MRRSSLRLLAALALIAGGAAAAPEPAALTLDEAVKLALARNERARVAESQVEVAEARVRRARAFFFPDVTLSGTYTRRASAVERNGEVVQDVNALGATLTVGLTIFDARSIPAYRQARRELEATELESADDRRLLAFEAADAFLVTLTLEHVVQAAERRLAFARDRLADAQARVSAQLASSNDVTRAELELATAERELTVARADVDVARLELGFLLDTTVSGPLDPPAELLDAAAGSPGVEAELVAQAQRRRLDVAAGRARARALDAFALEPRLRWLPSLGLTGQYRVSNEGGFTGRTSDWFVGLTLTWVIWDGGERSAERVEREAVAQIAHLQTDALARGVALDVSSALAALGKAQAASQQARAAVDAARKNADETTALYKQGLARAIEVADANIRLFEAEVAVARERYGLALAYLDLRAAVGLDPLGREVAP